jgi:hypothetical protein
MFKVIFKVIVVLLFLGYAAFFLSWNMAPQEIIGWDLAGVRYTQALPVGALAFIGLFVGAIVMAASCWSAWATQRALAKKAVATVKKAKVKLQAQLDMINELRGEVTRLEGELEGLQAGDGTWGRVAASDLPGADLASSDAPATADDDDDVI